jgi:radical SAM superfamily enzyme YgiQ (UPF0313 family)
MIFSDKKHGMDYLEEIVTNHVSGQLKIAPEHTEDNVLRRMGKTGKKDLLQFKNLFDDLCKKAHKEQYLTYYFIAAHPGCTDTDMYHLKEFSSQILHISPEQVQIFTPSPSTYSSLMYYTELDPFTLQPLYVEKDSTRREHQKQIIIEKPNLITQKKQRSYHKK